MTLYGMMIWLTMSGVLGQPLEAWIELMQKGFWQSSTWEGDIDFVTLQILLHEGRINVYDCKLMVTEHVKFLTFIQPFFELMHSGIMNDLPEKLLTQPWEFNGRVEHIVQNRTRAACGSYSLTHLQPPKTLLCDNLIKCMQYVWAYEIISQS